ncbi:unnamed protein product [Lactuca virosa]|uniref:F-box domain-containing protein n=1 Tax=Lactuca virosa TaxID=75947 RepID=A0AAU9NTI4_9ASTR|nr:unnamed protein product [Lactuca virosa]
MTDNQAMTEIYERMFISCVEEDRISNLPEHLIDSILEWLRIEDVARTSIISKNWRYRWTTMRKLVFDKPFFKKILHKRELGRNGFLKLINKILILHNGSISEFYLYIPNMFLENYKIVDQCMQLLSKKGVKELVLMNSNKRYNLSSHVFFCPELTKLELENCFFKPPLEFQGFLNLKELYLHDIDFGPNMCGTRINLPQLEELYLLLCMNVYNFNINATKLLSLNVSYCPDAMLLRLLDSPSIIDLQISSQAPKKGLAPVERTNLARMLSNLPIIELLDVDCDFFKYGIEEIIPKWLPHEVKSLKCLELQDIQLGDMSQLHGVLCLLRNSPNVESLSMTLSDSKDPGVDEVRASNHLESPNCLDYTLNKLQNSEDNICNRIKTRNAFYKSSTCSFPFS